MMTSNADVLQDPQPGRLPRPHTIAGNQCRGTSVSKDPNIILSIGNAFRPTHRIGALSLTLAILLCSACADVPVAPDRLVATPGTNTSRGDRNDIEVSVDAALARAHIAPVALTERPDGSLLWELRTPRDEPGSLIVSFTPGPTESDPVAVSMECRVGRFGDPETEQLIVRSVAQRLEQLRGRDYYRITWN